MLLLSFEKRDALPVGSFAEAAAAAVLSLWVLDWQSTRLHDRRLAAM